MRPRVNHILRVIWSVTCSLVFDCVPWRLRVALFLDLEPLALLYATDLVAGVLARFRGGSPGLMAVIEGEWSSIGKSSNNSLSSVSYTHWRVLLVYRSKVLCRSFVVFSLWLNIICRKGGCHDCVWLAVDTRLWIIGCDNHRIVHMEAAV